MFTPEEWKALQLKDEVETLPLMQGLGSEPVILTVKEIDGHKDGIVFAATYHGISLGTWKAKNMGDTLAWEFAK